MMNRNIQISLVCLGAFSLYANGEVNLPVIEILGQKYYVYESKKGDSLYGIARQFGWDDNELARVNPTVMSPLKKKVKVYYPCNIVADKGQQAPAIDRNTPTVGEEITHKVKKGETVYAISHTYNVPVEKIYSLNPSSRMGIKEGEILRIKEEDHKIEAGVNPSFYKVKKGDTLYQLARDFDTTVAEILSMNPGISESSFKAGTTIKIPERGAGVKIEKQTVAENRVESFDTYKVNKGDTWDTVAQKTGVDVKDLKEANQDVKKLKGNNYIAVPVIVTDSGERMVKENDPRELTYRGVSEIYEDVHGINGHVLEKPVYKVAILLGDPASRKDMDFTRGFLTGVDRLKNQNYGINLRVFDATVDSTSLIESVGAYDPTMIFSTFEKNTPGFLSDFARVSETPMVNTFDLKDEQYNSNPYIIQMMAPSAYFSDEIANSLNEQYKDANLIFVGHKNNSDQLASALNDLWNKKYITSYESPASLDDVTFWDSDTYLIYGNATKKNDISDLLKKVKEIRENNPSIKIGFVGRPNWMIYDESMRDELQAADVMIPSRFYFDKGSYQAKDFLDSYKDLFDMVPQKSYPMYAAVGYDVVNYFLPALNLAGGDFNKLNPSTVSVQTDFDLRRPVNWSGMLNPLVYLVRFTPYGIIEKIKVK